MRTEEFDYLLPPELIAQTPVSERDQSRLMVLNRSNRTIEHRQFFEVVDFLHEGDVLVLNDSRVMPARLRARKVNTGGKLEILLLRRLEPNIWEALVRPAKRAKIGDRIEVVGSQTNKEGHRLPAEVVGIGERGIRVIHFEKEAPLSELGKIAPPPYVHVPLREPERYQTVYAREEGSVAAPTAGLHFTPRLLENIKDKGVRCQFVTLHVGLDTFQPVGESDPREHTIHQEYGVVSQEVARELKQAKSEGRRVVCVGTTSVRLVEAAAHISRPDGVSPLSGWVDLFILPGYRFRVVDILITNFHLPRSTLLMMVSAFAGKDFILRAYREAADLKYRFYSFGDAMLIL
ncbi:MAG TPA: tRNA preQ1(34) S-adenosylmethionine ribosyltransferase-isomerase QueA [Dehalococcoidia bacterium]|nr:tRNA preQ1(34) S-adenosylmethionine ribosyltransferase-isomerase QueA [Dehalococcoidia bacterium]